MKKPYYFYSTGELTDTDRERIERVNAAGTAGCAMLFIGAAPDLKKLKEEVNYLADANYHLFCVTRGEPEFDQGLKLQLGLATVYDADSDYTDQLISDMQSAGNGKSLNMITVVLMLVVLVAAAVSAKFLLVPKEEAEVPDETETAVTDVAAEAEVPEFIELDEIYLAALEAAGVDTDADGRVSKEEMEAVTVLDLSGLGISSLEPLLYAVNITELDLSDNNISDITNLAALGKLEKLNLQGNPVEDYSVLDYLPNLKDIIK